MPTITLELEIHVIKRYADIAERMGLTSEELMKAVLYTEVMKVINREISEEERARIQKKTKDILLTGIKKGLKEDAVEGKKRVRK